MLNISLFLFLSSSHILLLFLFLSKSYLLSASLCPHLAVYFLRTLCIFYTSHGTQGVYPKTHQEAIRFDWLLSGCFIASGLKCKHIIIMIIRNVSFPFIPRCFIFFALDLLFFLSLFG